MGTNLEGRLIALEIERKRLAERLERALADIAELKQARRTSPGLGWGWGSGMGQPRYVAQINTAIGPLDSGNESGTGDVFRLSAVSGDVGLTTIGLGLDVYNGTYYDIPPSVRVPVTPDASGNWWITDAFDAFVAVADIACPAAGGPPPSGFAGTGFGNVYGLTGTTYTHLGTYYLHNPHDTDAPAGTALVVVPTGINNTFLVVAWV